MRNKHHVIIAGAGIAGLNAARVLSAYGLDILLLDDNMSPGGQYLRRVSKGLGVDFRPTGERSKRNGYRLVHHIANTNVRIESDTEILGIEGGRLVWALGKDGKIECHRCEHLILATGARERFLPFPGWTLPGVISTGAAQILMKACGMLPGRKHLVGGAGPLPLLVAGEIAGSGGRVCAYWNQMPLLRQFSFLPGVWHHFAKLAQGMRQVTRLFLSGARLRHGCKILKARGNGVLKEAVLAKIDGKGRVIQDSEKVYSVDCLAVGYGFVPNLELALLSGCDLTYDAAKGGWIVKVNNALQSSVPSIVAAGEITGIAGAEKSAVEGKMAGLFVAYKMGSVSESIYHQEMFRLQKKRRAELRFGGAVNAACRVPEDMLKDVPDSTLVCRCEDITMGEIRQRIADGFTTLDALKKATNAGMGNCQGRTCGPILQDILQTVTPAASAELRPFSIRGPIKPVLLSSLADCSHVESAD